MRRSQCWRKSCEALICFLSGVSHPYHRGEKGSFLHHTGSLNAKEKMIVNVVVVVKQGRVIIMRTT